MCSGTVPSGPAVATSELTGALDASLLADWERTGVVVVRRALDPARVEELEAWVRDLEDMPAAPAGPLQHYEQTDSGPVIARTERFADIHPGLGSFLRGEVAGFVAAICDEPVRLFKEKVNYKYPGGGGFAPHQDARAYRFAARHVSVMVPLDPAARRNGCLWFAANPGRSLLDSDERGRIAEHVCDGLDWYPVEVDPGDVVVFDSTAPHRSGTNRSVHPRRAMYLTYNAASEGDFRERYYRDKAADFDEADGTFGGARVRLSISDDFLGRPVPEGTDEPADTGASDVVDVLEGLYAGDVAGELYDEAVTELQHGLQAGWLAESEGAGAALIAAALLHDVGHLLVGDLQPIGEALGSDEHHEGVGAAWLRPHFGAAVADPVALHVAAKRYLCAVEPGYLRALSRASLRSLEVQGGPMSPAEASAFEANRCFGPAVGLRRWDDRAKVPGAPTPGFDHFVPVLRGLLGTTA